jgi:deoxyribonuclease IV
MMTKVVLGAHVSTAGGLPTAVEEGRAIGADVIQIFTRNQVQWKARPVALDEAETFKAAVAASGLKMVVTHGSYLVNLASPKADVLEKSRQAFLSELRRCHALGIPYLVFHPGAHMGAGEDAGLETIAASLDHVLERADGVCVMPLLEVTAGQGSYVGHRFEHLARILDRTRGSDHLGICLDTCHLLAAGYDIAQEEGYEKVMAEFSRVVGLPRLKAIHLNDAKKGLGSRLDRHEAVGEGFLGLEAFRRIVNDSRLEGLPLILETPGGIDEWKREIALLRSLRRAPS